MAVGIEEGDLKLEVGMAWNLPLDHGVICTVLYSIVHCRCGMQFYHRLWLYWNMEWGTMAVGIETGKWHSSLNSMEFTFGSQCNVYRQSVACSFIIGSGYTSIWSEEL